MNSYRPCILLCTFLFLFYCTQLHIKFYCSEKYNDNKVNKVALIQFNLLNQRHTICKRKGLLSHCRTQYGWGGGRNVQRLRECKPLMTANRSGSLVKAVWRAEVRGVIEDGISLRQLLLTDGPSLAVSSLISLHFWETFWVIRHNVYKTEAILAGATCQLHVEAAHVNSFCRRALPPGK